MKTDYLVITKQWQRHGSYSGYECVINKLKIEEIKGNKIFHFAANYLKNITKLTNYSSIALSKELELLFKLPYQKKIHVLYADMDYYYLHLLKKNIIGKNLKNQLIVTFHHPPEELENRLGYNRYEVLGALDKIIVLGRNQIPFFKKYSNAKIQFIPHGINTDFFKPGAHSATGNQILIIGISHRDHIITKKIITEIGKKAPYIKFKVVVPKDYKGNYVNLQNVILHTDKISDQELLYLYQSSRGVLLMLNNCTASNTLLESLATGCPLIINEIGAVRDYIPEDTNLPVFHKRDLNSIINHLITLCRNDKVYKSISQKQVELSKNYNWALISKTTQEFINL